MSFIPVDQNAREAVRHQHQASFVLQAGAGTGKTTLLVDRIESLVRDGMARLDEIAAVTFTELAATTMKLRLRERLERLRADVRAASQERERAQAALDVLERAQISTIHALCAAILQERPIECGVTPGFRVADEAETDLIFSQAWDEWLAERLVAADEDLLAAIALGIPLAAEGGWGERSSLRGLARSLIEQRDLGPLVATTTVDPARWRSEILAQAAAGRALAAEAKEEDTLAQALLRLDSFARAACEVEGEALIRRLSAPPKMGRNLGQKGNWPAPERLQAAREIAVWVQEAAQRWSAERGAELHARLTTLLAGVGRSYAARKRERGALDFVDLLLATRDALVAHEGVRRAFRERFRFIIIDEFQDTDPLQVEIARQLAGDTPGRLVVVGDAKQSIYRFRRANVTLLGRVAAEIGARPGCRVLSLTQNFRSRPAILRFVNRVFERLILASSEADQTEYEPIAPPPDLPSEAAVVALRFDAPFLEGDDLLEAEARAHAAFLAQVARGRLRVRDPATGAERPSRAGDVMVLARRLTKLRPFEEACEAYGLRFVVEGGKSFFDRSEVHETLAVLRAVEDPLDRAAVVAALRSPFFGVSDRDLVSFALSGGALRVGSCDVTLPGAETIAPALALLAELRRLRTLVPPAQLIERLYDETRILAAFTGTPRGEGRAANLEKTVALARKAADLGILTLRGFSRFLEGRIRQGGEEPDLPSTRPGDPEVIRVLSIHKSKGLEAPIVALYDSADDAKPMVDSVPLWDEGQIAVGFRAGCQPPRWNELRAREEKRAWAEGRRLLYVACTRARDFLIVPQPSQDARLGGFWKDVITALPTRPDGDVFFEDAASLPGPEPTEPPAEPGSPESSLDVRAARWDDERRALIESAAARPLAPISVVRYAERSAPPFVAPRGRSGGRDFGSLVHRILEELPFAAPDAGLALARVWAPVYGLDDAAAQRAAGDVSRTLALAIMDRARRSRQIWRELPLLLPEETELIEGVADLVFEEQGGFIVVDYKTDAVTDVQAIDQAAHHAPQLRAYGRALALATGVSVKERHVIFTAIGRAVQV
jgi:ATP-dependent helicase/nuclease subunit A